MKITFVKESFGPFRVSGSKDINKGDKVNAGTAENPKMVDAFEHYLTLGLLHEAERTPATTAEKPYWPFKDKKGNPARVSQDGKQKFSRADISGSPEVAEAIRASFAASGYSDVKVELRDVKEAGPAWKAKVAAYVGLMELDDDMTPERVRENVTKLAGKLGLDASELLAYAEEKGLPATPIEAPAAKANAKVKKAA